MSIRVTAVIVVGGMKVDVPIDVSDLQFKFLARVTIKPLVEALPCVGGVTISLLEEPKVMHVRMILRVLGCAAACEDSIVAFRFFLCFVLVFSLFGGLSATLIFVLKRFQF